MAQYQLIVNCVYGVPHGAKEMQLVVGHGDSPEVRSTQSWGHSPNMIFDWKTIIQAEDSDRLFVAVCVKDRPLDLLVKFYMHNPDGAGAAAGKWCSHGELSRGLGCGPSHSSESSMPPQLCYQIVPADSKDGADSVYSGWSVPNKEFADDGTHPPTKVGSVVEGELKIQLGDVGGSEVRGQGSGDAVINEEIQDDKLSDASTGVGVDDSISMAGRGAGGPPSAIFETKSKGGGVRKVMVNPDVSPAKLAFWEVDPRMAGMQNNVQDARISLYLLLKDEAKEKDWNTVVPIFQLLRNAGPASPIRIEEFCIGLDWTTGYFDVDYTYGPQSGYDDAVRGQAANCINGAEMLLDALSAPWQAGWVGGMDRFMDQKSLPVAQAALGAWIGKAPREKYPFTYTRTQHNARVPGG